MSTRNLTLYEIIDTDSSVNFDNIIDESDLLVYAHEGHTTVIHKLIKNYLFEPIHIYEFICRAKNNEPLVLTESIQIHYFNDYAIRMYAIVHHNCIATKKLLEYSQYKKHVLQKIMRMAIITYSQESLTNLTKNTTSIVNSDYLSIIKLLFRYGAYDIINDSSLLNIAVGTGSIDLIKFILEHSCVIDKSILLATASRTTLYPIDFEITKILIEHMNS